MVNISFFFLDVGFLAQCYLTAWGNKNWPPSMKVQMENY